MTDKPLSETHPTLINAPISAVSYEHNNKARLEVSVSWLQYSTVDIAEHNRLMDKAINLFQEKQAELEKLQNLYYERNEEVERLKKELEETFTRGWEKGFEAGSTSLPVINKYRAEGERRAMQRVKEALDSAISVHANIQHPVHRGAFSALQLMIKELGLSDKDEEVQK